MLFIFPRWCFHCNTVRFSFRNAHSGRGGVLPSAQTAADRGGQSGERAARGRSWRPGRREPRASSSRTWQRYRQECAPDAEPGFREQHAQPAGAACQTAHQEKVQGACGARCSRTPRDAKRFLHFCLSERLLLGMPSFTYIVCLNGEILHLLCSTIRGQGDQSEVNLRDFA